VWSEVAGEDIHARTALEMFVMAEAALPAVKLDVPLGIEIGHGASWDAAH
jgi:DNA polymerase I